MCGITLSVLLATFRIHWPVSAKFNQIGKDLKGVRFAQAYENIRRKERNPN